MPHRPAKSVSGMTIVLTTHELNSVAVHLALLRTGKALLFSGDHKKIWDWTKGESSIWDPQDPTATNDPVLNRNLFCAGHCQLPDGRLFVAGGQSTFNHPLTIIFSVIPVIPLALKIAGREAADHDIHIFDPSTQTWTYQAKMPRARWYPTCVTLPDGKALIVSGTYSHAGHALFGGFINLDYEIFDPATNTLGSPQKFIDKIDMYPFLHVLPGGKLFVHSENETHFWDIASRKIIEGAKFHNKTEGTRTYPGMGSSVLLPLDPSTAGDDRAKILIVGGSTKLKPDNNTDATDVAEIFTANLSDPASSPGWEKVPAKPVARLLCDAVLLPDGKVLVTNGARKGIADDNKVQVMEIELFDPADSSWTVVGLLDKPRLYHSTALLLPDGRVLIAGSTGHRWTDAALSGGEHFEHHIEIFSPPYLNGNSDSNTGSGGDSSGSGSGIAGGGHPTRPTASNVPQSISYGTSFDVTTDSPDDIERVSLIRLSTTTHNNNMDQRCIMLPIAGRTTNAVQLSSPPDSTWAPPGYYMLFLVDRNGVPSEGKFVRVG